MHVLCGYLQPFVQVKRSPSSDRIQKVDRASHFFTRLLAVQTWRERGGSSETLRHKLAFSTR